MTDQEKKGEIIFNNVSSRTLGLIVAEAPVFTSPAQKMNIYEVPGRTGAIIDRQEAWENVDLSFKISFANNFSNTYTLAQRAETYEAIINKINDWLYNIYTEETGRYGVLKNSFEPSFQRYAYFAGPADFTTDLLRTGSAIITFNCNPKKYLLYGQREFTIELSHGYIRQEQTIIPISSEKTKYDFHPIFELSGLEAGKTAQIEIQSLNPGGTILRADTVTIEIPSGTPAPNAIIINCETGKVETPGHINLLDYITLDNDNYDFPMFKGYVASYKVLLKSDGTNTNTLVLKHKLNSWTI